MRPYRYHELHDREFEVLIGQVCLVVLGTGTIVFSEGKDGGRDGRFSGTAEAFPSSKSPYAGNFIVQAKHTSNPNASCSDSQFQSIFNKELLRVKGLAASDELDYYLLFTNRKLTGGQEAKLTKEINKIPKIKGSHILGVDNISSYLTTHPEIWNNLGLSRYDTPFRFDPQDLATVIKAFHQTTSNFDDSPFKSEIDFDFTGQETKGRINGLSKEYYAYIQADSLPYFASIKSFLGDPRNKDLRQLYHDAADELKQKIITFRHQFDRFDHVLTHVFDLIVLDNPEVRGKRRLVRLFLHYMYFDCDIGERDA